MSLGLPRGSSGKNLPAKCRQHRSCGFDPGSGRPPEEDAATHSVPSLEIPWTGSLAGHSPRVTKGLDTTEATQLACMHTLGPWAVAPKQGVPKGSKGLKEASHRAFPRALSIRLSGRCMLCGYRRLIHLSGLQWTCLKKEVGFFHPPETAGLALEPKVRSTQGFGCREKAPPSAPRPTPAFSTGPGWAFGVLGAQGTWQHQAGEEPGGLPGLGFSCLQIRPDLPPTQGAEALQKKGF